MWSIPDNSVPCDERSEFALPSCGSPAEVVIPCSKSHTWTTPGTYYIYVRGDDGLSYSANWGEVLQVNISSAEPPGHCFLEGTQVQMADGLKKKIENMRIGDNVLSFDEKTKTLQEDRVKKIYHVPPFQMNSDFYLLINNDLKVTPNHLLYVNNKWIQAKDMKIGDQLLIGEVISIEKIYEKVPIYNFETEKYHSYLVVFGDNAIIAHNAENYVLGGHDETVSLIRKTGVTDYDYTSLLSMDKIYELSETPYQEMKDLLQLPDQYDFFITIGNSEARYLYYVPLNPTITLVSGNVAVTCRENVMIVDAVGYAYATLEVTVVR